MNRLLGYLVTFLMIFLMLDGVLRIAGCGPQPQVVEFHATRGWANKASQVTHRSTSEFKVEYAFNSHRMRGAEIAEAKASGTKRILFIGDSFTLGYTVKENETFTSILERDLRADGHNVEVLNAGTEGYSTDQELVTLMEEGPKLHPDYVVLAPYLNDVYWNTQSRYTIRAKPHFSLGEGGRLRRDAEPLASTDLSWFKRHTAIGSTLDNFQRSQMLPWQRIGTTGNVMLEDAPLLADSPAVIDEAWEVTSALIANVSEIARGLGAKPIALLVPNKWEIHPDAEMSGNLRGIAPGQVDPGASTNKFQQLCAAAGFVVVDPRPELKAEAAKGSVLYFKKDWHWNADGYRIAAGSLLERFLKPDILGPGTGAVKGETIEHTASSSGIPTWAIVVGILWLVLGTFYARSYKRENPVFAYVKVAALIAFVGGVFYGVGKLAGSLPPAVGKYVTPIILIGLLVFILAKIWKRLSVIRELYGTFLRRGHWYMLPMIVVMLSIGMLLVVAASSPFVAPFIYTLF